MHDRMRLQEGQDLPRAYRASHELESLYHYHVCCCYGCVFAGAWRAAVSALLCQEGSHLGHGQER